MDKQSKELKKSLYRVKEHHYLNTRDLFLSVAGLVVIGLMIGLVVLSENIARHDETLLPKIKVAGVDVGKLNMDEAEDKLNQAVNDFIKEGLVFEYTDSKTKKSQEFRADPQDLGFLPDTHATLERAQALGHAGNFFSNLKAQLVASTSGLQVELVYNYEPAALEAFLDTNFLEIEEPARQASLKIVDAASGTLEKTESASGLEIDRANLTAQLASQTPTLQSETIKISLVKTEPQILVDDLDKLEGITQTILASNFNLYYDDKSYTLTSAVLADWIEFHSIVPEDVLGKSICACGLPQQIAAENDEAQTVPAMVVTPFDQTREGLPETDPYFVMLPPENFTLQNFETGHLMPIIGFNRDKVNHWLLTNVSANIDQPGQNARLTFTNGKVKVAQASIDGIEVDVEQAARDIVFAIADDNSETSTRLVLAESKPEINEEIIDELGINTLIGQGVSDFSGSPVNRVHNINTGFDKYSGLVIAPGEEFSVVEKLGPVDAAAGFLPELVIVGKKITPQYGGGLCQVSSTIFRAALDTGLPITERTNHSFAVSYYLWPYSEWGVEATIYDPAPDLKFRNDTEGHILIQAYTTPEGKAYVDFYGTDPGRETTIEGPWRLSGSMVAGGTTVFNYIVRDSSGAIIREQEFTSIFQPLAEFKHE